MFSFDGDEYAAIPEHTRNALLRYARNHIKAGGFIEALVSNDLMNAVGRADSVHKPIIGECVLWLMNQAPSGCFGSAAKYDEWISYTMKSDPQLW